MFGSALRFSTTEPQRLHSERGLLRSSYDTYEISFCFGFLRGEIDHPPVFLSFHYGNSFKIGKFMILLLRWYLTDYSEGLHTYYYILSKCLTQVSVHLIDGLSINRGK